MGLPAFICVTVVGRVRLYSEVLSDLEETAAGVPDFNILKAASLLNQYGVLKYTNPSIADVKKEADALGPFSGMTHEMDS